MWPTLHKMGSLARMGRLASGGYLQSAQTFPCDRFSSGNPPALCCNVPSRSIDWMAFEHLIAANESKVSQLKAGSLSHFAVLGGAGVRATYSKHARPTSQVLILELGTHLRISISKTCGSFEQVATPLHDQAFCSSPILPQACGHDRFCILAEAQLPAGLRASPAEDS